MIALVLTAFLQADHNPYHWTMSCQRWQQRSYEIMMDDNLSLDVRQGLVRYLRSKVDKECKTLLT